MKSEVEIEIRKIRKQLKIHGLSDLEKKRLRDTLENLKKSLKKEKT